MKKTYCLSDNVVVPQRGLGRLRTCCGRWLRLLPVLCALLLAPGLTGCDSVLGPQTHESAQMKRFIFLTSIDSDYYRSLLEEFIGDIHLGNVVVPGVESHDGFEGSTEDSEFTDAALYLFESTCKWRTYTNDDDFREKCFEYWDYQIDNGGGWGASTSERRYCQVLATQSERSELVKRALMDCFLDYCAEYAEDQVKVLNWDYERKSQGDSYTGYLVTYEIGAGYYVLAHLIEYDDSNRYRAEVIYRGESFTDLLDYIEE